MVINVTFNNISAIWWRLVSLAEETGVRGENHRPDASHWQTLSHNIVSRTPRHQRYLNSQTAIIVFKQNLNYHERSNVTTIFSKIMANIYLQVQWLIGMLDASGFLAPLQGNVQQKHNACSYLSSWRYNPIFRPAIEEEKTLIQQHLGVTTNDVTVHHYAEVGSITIEKGIQRADPHCWGQWHSVFYHAFCECWDQQYHPWISSSSCVGSTTAEWRQSV